MIELYRGVIVMKSKLFGSVFLFLALLFSFATIEAKEKESKDDNIFFSESRVIKKGMSLSELGLLGNPKLKIRYTDAMRFDANYVAAAALDGGKPFNLPIAEVQKHVARAHAALKSVKDNQAFTTALNGKNIELPIGIKRTVGNKDVTICLDSIVFTPSYAYGVLYVVIEDTKNNKTLAFVGRDIRFTKDGGFTGDARLELLETYDLNFGNNTTISFLVDGIHDNYVVFNCDGFKHLHVDARIFFSRNTFVPEQADGKIAPAPARVTTDFSTDFESLDNFMVSVANVPKFQVVGLEGFSFQVGTLAFDYSSTQNPSGIVFPAGYSHSALTSGTPLLWEGFFVQNLVITLPEQFKLKATPSKRISLALEKALIDKLGFTGKASISNLLLLTEGDMSGWDYSVEYISIDVLKSTPVGASFKGQLIIPITKEDERFEYNASIQPNNNYNFTVTSKTKLNFPLWGAGNVEINPDSWISIAIVDKKFRPEASLSGKLSITATINGKTNDNTTTDKGSNLSLAELSFIKLRLSTVGPAISLDPNGGAVSFGSPLMEQKMSNLPVTITNVGMVSKTTGQLGISFTVKVNLVGESENGGGFSGSASIAVYGEQVPLSNKWRYYKTELNRIELNNIKIAVLTLNGYIEFYRDDLVYGSGFAGGLKLEIDLKASKIGIDVKCIFGKKSLPTNPNDIYRYWAVDAMVSLPALTVFPPLLFINGFGGGANYHMGMNTTPNANAKFVSMAGIGYVPDNTKGLGLRAMIGIQGASRKLYEGQIIFEIQFSAEGGVSMIAFSGYVQIASLGQFDQLAKLKSSVGGMVDKVNATTGGKAVFDQPAASGASVYGEIQKMGDGGALLAQWRMVLDIDNKSFSAVVDVFVDVAGIIKGRNPNAHAGRIDILACPKEWHIMVGRPDAALGLNLIDIVDIGGYFMMGQNLPTPLPMPNGKRAAFPNVPVDGMGIGVRLHIGVEGGGSFWYRAGVDAGFDFLIWNVKGQICNGKQKGVKGWYGAGQAFLYGYAGAGFTKCVKYKLPCNCCKKRCWCLCCGWCDHQTCVNVSASLTIDISAQIEAANPTYAEARVEVCGIGIGLKVGKRCS